MQKLQPFGIAMAIFCLLFLVNSSDAINVDYVGPESSYDYYLWAGATQWSRADFDEPFAVVSWYVKKEGEEGYGTEEYIDYGDGIRTSSQFKHPFDTSNTSGEAYEITAYVYPDPNAADQSVDWDSWSVRVWTPPEEVITAPNALAILDDIKIGDSYALRIDVSSTSKNYEINEIEVFVNGVSVVTHNVSGATATEVNVTGILGASTGNTMLVEAFVRGGLKAGGKIGGFYLTKLVWRALLRTTLYGDCECSVDGNPLDNKKELPFWCWVEADSQEGWVKDTRFNTTIVEYEVLKANNLLIKKKRKAFTNNAGRYVFSHKVPIGYLINVKLKSDDMHFHGPNHNNHPTICKYESTVFGVDTGNVMLEIIPTVWDQDIQVNFSLTPYSVHDPCNGAYP